MIGYGIVQTLAPRLLTRADPQASRALELAAWTAAPGLILIGLYAALSAGLDPLATLVIGLGLFGILFAVCSTLHSYLIVAFSPRGTVVRSVAFYYMSNAAGRFLGTAASAGLYQWAGGGLSGLLTCLIGASLCLAIAALSSWPLHAAERAAA